MNFLPFQHQFDSETGFALSLSRVVFSKKRSEQKKQKRGLAHEPMRQIS